MCCVCVCVCVRQDVDECDPSSCLRGTCINTYGTYFCLNPDAIGLLIATFAYYSHRRSIHQSLGGGPSRSAEEYLGHDFDLV